MPTVLLVAHHFPPHVGGLELVVERQARSLAASGFRVIVLTSRSGNTRAADDFGPLVEVVRIPCWHFFERRFFIPFPLFSPRLVLEARKLLKRADVVHVHDVFYLSSWVVALLARLARKPLLLTQHVAMVEHSSGFVMAVQRLVYATAGKWIFSRARRIVVYNDNVRAFLRVNGVPDDRVLQLVNGIDTRRFLPATPQERRAIRDRYGLPQDRALVLFVGRLVEKKGYHLLLEARDPGFDLVFVGPGTVPAGEFPGVHWLGALEQSQIAELYRACNVFAFPAVGEIFTLAMQEAMASGLPVVTTDDPAYAQSIVSGHVTLCPRTPAAFRDALCNLLANPSTLRSMGANGRDIAVRHFDWHANFQPIIDMYSTLLREKAS